MRKQRDLNFKENEESSLRSKIKKFYWVDSPFHILLCCYNSLLILCFENDFSSCLCFHCNVVGHLANTKSGEQYKKSIELASK